MKITVVSDLHLEFSPISFSNSQNADILILSGDILISEILHDYPREREELPHYEPRQIQALRFREFLKECSEQFKHVIYVSGNHELYYGKFYAGIEYLREECSFFQNVHFLENNSVTIDDVLFIGATLWTDANNSDPLTLCNLPSMINDYKLIRNDHCGVRKLRIDDTVKRHRESIAYIAEAVINAPSDKKIVVVTHHSPCLLSIPDKYKNMYEMNGGYHSDLSKFILNNPLITLWTHGHTHTMQNYTVGETRIVCNPRGYENASYSENTGWNPNLILEI